MKTRRRCWLLSCLLIVAVAACGDQADKSTNNTIYHPPNDGGTDASADIGADAGGDATTPPDADGDAFADTTARPEGSRCGQPTDLGTLETGRDHVFDASVVRPADSLNSSCDLGATATGVHVFSVQVAVTAQVEFWSTLSPSRLDLRRGDCAAPSDVLTCTAGGRYTATLEAGQMYHLAVWGDIDTGDFQLHVDVQEAVCSVSDPDECAAGQLDQCVQNVRVRSTDCLGQCADATSCAADQCVSATPVDLSDGAAITHSGGQRAYHDHWTASQKSNCGFTPNTPGVDTAHEEFFFHLTGLSAGQQVTVESLATGDFAFFVLDDCTADRCLKAVDDTAAGGQRLIWAVPAAGDYVVVIESLAHRSRPIKFRFDVD